MVRVHIDPCMTSTSSADSCDGWFSSKHAVPLPAASDPLRRRLFQLSPHSVAIEGGEILSKILNFDRFTKIRHERIRFRWFEQKLVP